LQWRRSDRRKYFEPHKKMSLPYIIAIIPARGGSKRLTDKNIFPLNGKPLLAYTIEACKRSKYIKDIFVSSDSDAILLVGEEYGARAIKRESSFSDDKTPKVVAIRRVIEQLRAQNINPDIVIIPQANSPQISAEIMDEGFDLMLKHNLWEVMSADKNGVQNAAFRIVRTEHLFNTFLSAHCGFVTADILDVHTIEDIRKLEGLMK
jgi:CMP-N,N'-diacetyllegionaminic acid synthase